MSYITISEFDHFERDGLIPVALFKEQRVDINLVSTSSAPFQCKYIIVSTSVPVGLAFGPEPEAFADKHVIHGERIYSVNIGSRLAVIAAEE